MSECVFNPETKRCVLKRGKVGQDVIKKYGDMSADNCVYNAVTKRCAKNNSKVSPKVSPKLSPKVSPKLSPKLSPQAIRHITHIAAGAKLSQSLKHISSNNCEIINILTNNGFKIKKIESLTKNSASDTIIIKLTTDKGVELLAKIGYQRKNVKLDELFAENFIYKFLNKFNLPFVVEYVKQFTCPNIDAFLRQFSPTIAMNLSEMYSGSEIHRGFNILLTKMCSDKCKTLHNLLISGINAEDANAILLQCIYTLVYFEEIGLQHNDLHTGNIFVEENPSNISLKFDDKITFNFSSKYLVKIYDFDFSSIVPTKFNYKTFYPNGRNDRYMERTLCISNKSNHGIRDTAQFLLNYSRYSNTKLLQILVFLSLPSDLINASYYELLPHPGHPCKFNENSGYEVFPNIKSTKTAMRSFPEELIKVSGNYLNLPGKHLNLISPILPSLAKNCKEYTDMSECLTPVKKGISLEAKQKFNKALIKVAKSV